MIIDSHQHFWHYEARRDAWITDEMSMLRRDFLPEELIPELTANEVDGSIAVQTDQSENETLFLLDLASVHPKIKGVVGWVDIRAPELAERLRYFAQFEKLCGFRHIVQSEPDDCFLVRDDFVHGISCLTEFDFTYDILIYPRQLRAAIELVARFPRQRFVLDHMAKPSIRTAELTPWADHLVDLARYPNVYCKLSGLVTEAHWQNWRPANFRPYLDVAMAAFGPERLMFGSDWPVCLLAGSYRDVKNLLFGCTSGLPQGMRDRIFGLNAIEFYRLKTLRSASGIERPETNGSGTTR